VELATAQDTDDLVAADRIDEVLDRADEFFSHVLWETDTGAGVRKRLAKAGVEEETLREFGIGYAPVGHRDLLEHLGQWDFSADELIEAGVATGSGRGHLHAHFRSRVMFPIRDRDGKLRGFAGLATHLGPSWPLWLVSPDRGRYRKSEAIFAIDRAGPGITEAGRAQVLDDCLEVLRLHQQGDANAVAVTGNPVTGEHLEQLAAELSVEASELGLERLRARRRSAISRLLVGPIAELGEGAFRPAERTDAETGNGGGTAVAERPEEGGRRGRVLQAIASVALGAAVPIGWVAAVTPSEGDPGGASSTFVVALLGVAATYVALGIASGVLAARAQRRSSERRMRAPWQHGAGEWQPLAWTYHRLEGVLIGAAVVSIVVSAILFVAVAA
jgi:hypothetical protein